MNGHLGLNEPGTSFDTYSHVIDLDQVTIDVAQKYFKDTQSLSKGITIGLKHFLECKKLILVMCGYKKKNIAKQILESSISTQLPASICKLHSNCTIIADSESLSLVNLDSLNYNYIYVDCKVCY